MAGAEHFPEVGGGGKFCQEILITVWLVDWLVSWFSTKIISNPKA